MPTDSSGAVIFEKRMGITIFDRRHTDDGRYTSTISVQSTPSETAEGAFNFQFRGQQRMRVARTPSL